MSVSLVPVGSGVALEILGLDVENMTNEMKAEFRQAFLENSVILLRGVKLTPDSHVALTRVLGVPEVYPNPASQLPGYPVIVVPDPRGYMASQDPEEIIGKIPWHADLTYLETLARGALLRAVEIPPEGGQTGFIDTAAVYESLAESEKERIDSLQVVHSMEGAKQKLDRTRTTRKSEREGDREFKSEVDFPDVVQPLVLTDPVTGVKSLNISPLFTVRILGMSNDEGADLLARLTEYATLEENIYWHDWMENDLVVWNNYRTLHCAAGFKNKYNRKMHRTTVNGEVRFGRVLGL